MSLFPELKDSWPRKGTIFVHKEHAQSAMVTQVTRCGDGTDIIVVLDDHNNEFELNDYTFYDWLEDSGMKIYQEP